MDRVAASRNSTWLLGPTAIVKVLGSLSLMVQAVGILWYMWAEGSGDAETALLGSGGISHPVVQFAVAIGLFLLVVTVTLWRFSARPEGPTNVRRLVLLSASLFELGGTTVFGTTMLSEPGPEVIARLLPVTLSFLVGFGAVVWTLVTEDWMHRGSDLGIPPSS
jgi:hypothetical protein